MQTYMRIPDYYICNLMMVNGAFQLIVTMEVLTSEEVGQHRGEI